MFSKRSVKVTDGRDGSEKRNRQLAFELHNSNSHVCEKRSKPF